MQRLARRFHRELQGRKPPILLLGCAIVGGVLIGFVVPHLLLR
ncbi:MAG TPA: hypothetical protein VK101_08870 [Limnochordia bacterium]|nr:hypothetical protein [Limnochordia bacterium]